MKQQLITPTQAYNIFEKHFSRYVHSPVILINLPFVQYLSHRKLFHTKFKLAGTYFLFHKPQNSDSYNIQHGSFMDLKQFYQGMLNNSLFVLMMQLQDNACPKVYISFNSEPYAGPNRFIDGFIIKSQKENNSINKSIKDISKRFHIEFLNSKIPFDYWWKKEKNAKFFGNQEKVYFIKILELAIYDSVMDYYKHVKNIFPKKTLKHISFSEIFKKECSTGFFRTSSCIELDKYLHEHGQYEFVHGKPKPIYGIQNQAIRANYKVSRLKNVEYQHEIAHNLAKLLVTSSD